LSTGDLVSGRADAVLASHSLILALPAFVPALLVVIVVVVVAVRDRRRDDDDSPDQADPGPNSDPD
jgi:hypothetical protein